MPTRRSLARAFLLVALGATAVGCAGPARTDGSYRGKAATTADQVRSSIETVLVGIDAAQRHHLPSAYVSTLLAEAEEDADAAEATFASVQPPSTKADAVRDRALTTIGAANDALAQARIRARRSDTAGLVELVPGLKRASRRLDALTTSLAG